MSTDVRDRVAADETDPARFVTMTPQRVLDTRDLVFDVVGFFRPAE